MSSTKQSFSSEMLNSFDDISDSYTALCRMHDNPFAYPSGAFAVILHQNHSLITCSLRIMYS